MKVWQLISAFMLLLQVSQVTLAAENADEPGQAPDEKHRQGFELPNPYGFAGIFNTTKQQITL